VEGGGMSEKWDENDVDGYEWIVILVLISGTSINGVGVMM
jgi:hypothetical protein